MRRRPYLSSDGTLSLDAEPLSRFDLYRRPDEKHELLHPDVLPSAKSEDFQWLLMNALLQSCEYRLSIRWGKFRFGWTITIHEERIVRAGAEQAEFALLVKSLFDHPGGLPKELAFLAQASYLHAYLAAQEVRALVEAENGAGLLARLGHVYGSSEEPITRAFGNAIAQLHHFIRIAGTEGAALFMCYHTA